MTQKMTASDAWQLYNLFTDTAQISKRPPKHAKKY